MDDGSTVNIIYLNAYKRMGLTENDLDSDSSLLYSFTGDHVIPKGVAKLTIMVGEHSRTSTILANFLIVKAPSTINGIIGRPLLEALKVATLIYHLTMKFPTAEETGEIIRGNQYDSKEYYNKSLRIAGKDNKSPRASMEKAMASSSKKSDVTEQAHA